MMHTATRNIKDLEQKKQDGWFSAIKHRFKSGWGYFSDDNMLYMRDFLSTIGSAAFFIASHFSPHKSGLIPKVILKTHLKRVGLFSLTKETLDENS